MDKTNWGVVAFWVGYFLFIAIFVVLLAIRIFNG